MKEANHMRSPKTSLRATVLTVTLVILCGCSWLQTSEPRLIAIGDLHGDHGAFEEVMTRAGLMNKDGNWAGGKTLLIQVGDIADRGPDSRQIIEHLRRLEAQADVSGGQIIAMIGNHEAMVMTGDLRYVHPGEYAAFVTNESDSVRDQLFADNEAAIVESYREEQPELTLEEVKAQWEARIPLGAVEHQEAWAPDGEIGSWVLNNHSVVIVGDTLFVHGGLSAKYTAHSLADINNAAVGALNAQTRDREMLIHDPLGPQWYRGLLREPCGTMESGVNGTSLTIEEELEIVLAHFEVERIVVGHTPSLEGIKANHNGQVIQIDTGMSEYYGGTNSFLEITDDGVFANNDGVVFKIEDPVAVDPAVACEATAADYFAAPAELREHLVVGGRDVR